MTTSTRRILIALPTIALALNTIVASAGPAAAAQVGQSGQLSGQSDHITTGTVSIEEVDGKTYIVLGENFSLDGAPDPSVGFSVNGKFVEGSNFAELKSLTGGQRYEVPASLDLTDFDAFVVWCAQFSVPLGSADLN